MIEGAGADVPEAQAGGDGHQQHIGGDVLVAGPLPLQPGREAI